LQRIPSGLGRGPSQLIRVGPTGVCTEWQTAVANSPDGVFVSNGHVWVAVAPASPSAARIFCEAAYRAKRYGPAYSNSAYSAYPPLMSSSAKPSKANLATDEVPSSLRVDVNPVGLSR
jgi:hypothetical protein